MSRLSRKRREMSCMPIGSPLRPRPQGTDNAGKPVTLRGQVLRFISIEPLLSQDPARLDGVNLMAFRGVVGVIRAS